MVKTVSRAISAMKSVKKFAVEEFNIFFMDIVNSSQYGFWYSFVVFRYGISQLAI